MKTLARATAAAAMALLTAVCLVIDWSWPMALLALAAVGLAILTVRMWNQESRKLDEALTLMREPRCEPTPCDEGAHYMLAEADDWLCAECGHREPRNARFYDRAKDRAV